MTSDHHPSTGAGNPHSPAPLSIPVFSICDVCGQADEQSSMVDGMCRECIGVVREGIRLERERRVGRFDALTAAVIGFWAAVIVWRWMR